MRPLLRRTPDLGDARMRVDDEQLQRYTDFVAADEPLTVDEVSDWDVALDLCDARALLREASQIVAGSAKGYTDMMDEAGELLERIRQYMETGGE